MTLKKILNEQKSVNKSWDNPDNCSLCNTLLPEKAIYKGSEITNLKFPS